MRVVFIGTGAIGLPVLRWLMEAPEHELVGVVTQPDKPVGRAQRIESPPIKAAVSGSGIPVLQPARIKREEAVRAITALTPDIMIVMAYGQILSRGVLEVPKIACLNLHASLLPRHRGAAPIQSAIVAGDAETGITVMYMDEGLDTGDILLQTRTPMAPAETGGSLHDGLAAIAPAALQKALRLLSTETAPRIAQDNTAATCAPKLEREHGLIDWSEPPELIERKIRAFDPWPSAHTVLSDRSGAKRKLKIFRASVEAEIMAPAGQLLVSANSLVIGAAAGALSLSDVQLEGKKRMSAADLLRGNSWIAEARIAAAV